MYEIFATENQIFSNKNLIQENPDLANIFEDVKKNDHQIFPIYKEMEINHKIKKILIALLIKKKNEFEIIPIKNETILVEGSQSKLKILNNEGDDAILMMGDISLFWKDPDYDTIIKIGKINIEEIENNILEIKINEKNFLFKNLKMSEEFQEKLSWRGLTPPPKKLMSVVENNTNHSKSIIIRTKDQNPKGNIPVYDITLKPCFSEEKTIKSFDIIFKFYGAIDSQDLAITNTQNINTVNTKNIEKLILNALENLVETSHDIIECSEYYTEQWVKRSLSHVQRTAEIIMEHTSCIL